MKKVILLFLVVLASCSSIQTTYDFDSTVDFSKYKTYEVTDDAKGFPIQELDRQRVLTAIESELAAKGFTKPSSSPDVLIDLQVKLEQKQTATSHQHRRLLRWSLSLRMGCWLRRHHPRRRA